MFLTLEGGEGAGKSTLSKILKERFQAGGDEVVLTREPGGSLLGELIRDFALNPKYSPSPKAELLLFLAARAQHLDELILPALAEGKMVLCDRFHDSTIAYQGYGREADIQEVTDLCMAVSGKYQPDLTLYLDIDPAIGLKRGSEAPDRLEQETLCFHQRLRRGFQELAKAHPDRIVTLDATLPIEEVAEFAWKSILHAV
jgi:dTMP kinase